MAQGHVLSKNDDASKELAVGISALVSPGVPGFECTIKHRYTDFLVNEILPDGTVLHLTNDAAENGQQPKKDIDGPAKHIEEEKATVDTVETTVEPNEGTLTKRKEPHGGLDQPDGDQTAQKSRRVEASTSDDLSATANVTESAQEPKEPVSNRERKEKVLADFPGQDRAALHDIFGTETTNQILNLYASVLLQPERKPREQPTVKSGVIPEKAKRTEAHIAVRRIFSSRLETSTMQDLPGVISIKAASPKGPSGARGQAPSDSNGAIQKGKLGWNELGGEYLHFSLYKENKDTMEVLYFIASQLKVHIKNFQFAGTKDRRGVTVQRVAIFRVHADKIARLNRNAKGWRAGNFEYKKHGLDLGELGGNEFLLTLRDCHFEGEESLAHDQKVSLARKVVTNAAETFRDGGFLNYYGLQRFGTFSTGTHVTGLRMLKGNLEGAIDSILTYSEDLLPENQDMSGSKKVPQDDINRADAIRIWRNGQQSSDVTSKLPRRFQAESAIINYLGKRDRKSGKLVQEKDWQGALMQIQRNLRLMYVHAYQSFVWNTVVGKRLELYGNQLVEGDLVIVGEKDEVGPAKDEVDEDGEPVFHPAEEDSAPNAEDQFTRARPLSKEEVESGNFDIFDVVLPLPGYDVLYPANKLGKFYEEFMASDAGGGMDPHNMRRAWKDISLSGSYRKMMAKPGKGFGFEVKSYSNDEEQMVETDLEKLEKQKGNANTASGAANGDSQVQDADRKVAVVIKLQLGSSQYATMALRELTKGGARNYRPDYSVR